MKTVPQYHMFPIDMTQRLATLGWVGYMERLGASGGLFGGMVGALGVLSWGSWEFVVCSLGPGP